MSNGTLFKSILEFIYFLFANENYFIILVMMVIIFSNLYTMESLYIAISNHSYLNRMANLTISRVKLK